MGCYGCAVSGWFEEGQLHNNDERCSDHCLFIQHKSSRGRGSIIAQKPPLAARTVVLKKRPPMDSSARAQGA
jgi:hypothetical protein